MINGKTINNWMHSFIFSTSDLIIEKPGDVIDWIKEFKEKSSSKQVKDMSIIEDSIKLIEKYVNF